MSAIRFDTADETGAVNGRPGTPDGGPEAAPGSAGLRGYAFLLPYLLLFVFFVIYPVFNAVQMMFDPEAYRRLFHDSKYWTSLWNTVLFLFFAANIKMCIALVLSGYFVSTRRIVKVVSLIFLLPWALPHVPAILSINWMLNADFGWVNVILFRLFGIEGPAWLSKPDTAFAAIIGTHIWKYLPFWTMILVAGRLAIDRSLYEAAAMDGATSLQMFRFITFPQIKGLFITSTMLTTIWSLGDFNSVYLLTGGGPFDRTHTLATLGIKYAFTEGNLSLGLITMMTALPILAPMVFVLLRRMNRGQ